MAISDQKIIPDEYDCGVSVAVDDLVYVNSGGLLQKAKASSLSTMPAIGIVIRKAGSGKCIIDSFILQTGLSGIVNRKRYFVSATVAGAFQDTPPIGSGEILQKVGTGIGTTKRQVHIDPTNFIIRN